jgi:hypothetical protein
MATRLLFKVVHKGEQEGAGTKGTIGTVKLAPIYPGNLPAEDPMKAEIEKFYAYTPAGQIEFAPINEAALSQFSIGDRFYVTLEKAEAA